MSDKPKFTVTEVNWGEHHSLVVTDTADGWLDALLWLSQFKTLPTVLASLAVSAEMSVAKTMTKGHIKQAVAEYKESVGSVREQAVKEYLESVERQRDAASDPDERSEEGSREDLDPPRDPGKPST